MNFNETLIWMCFQIWFLSVFYAIFPFYPDRVFADLRQNIATKLKNSI